MVGCPNLFNFKKTKTPQEGFDYLWARDLRELSDEDRAIRETHSELIRGEISFNHFIDSNYLYDRCQKVYKLISLVKESGDKDLLCSLMKMDNVPLMTFFGGVNARDFDFLKDLLPKFKYITPGTHLNYVFNLAVGIRNQEIIDLFLIHGTYNYDSAMITAASKGYIEIVELMLSLDASSLNESMLLATYNGYLDITKKMVKEGANDYFTLLTTSKHCGHYDEIKKFLIEEHINDPYGFGLALEKVASNLGNGITINGYLNFIPSSIEKEVETASWILETISGEIPPYFIKSSIEISEKNNNKEMELLLREFSEKESLIEYLNLESKADLLKFSVNKKFKVLFNKLLRLYVNNISINDYSNVVKYILIAQKRVQKNLLNVSSYNSELRNRYKKELEEYDYFKGAMINSSIIDKMFNRIKDRESAYDFYSLAAHINSTELVYLVLEKDILSEDKGIKAIGATFDNNNQEMRDLIIVHFLKTNRGILSHFKSKSLFDYFGDMNESDFIRVLIKFCIGHNYLFLLRKILSTFKDEISYLELVALYCRLDVLYKTRDKKLLEFIMNLIEERSNSPFKNMVDLPVAGAA